MSDLTPSHVLVRVEDLARSVAEYEAAGFTVQWGSDPETAHNALIHFREGPFIELFDPVPGDADPDEFRAQMPPRVGAWLDARGLCEHALEGDRPMQAILEGLAARGIETGPAFGAERTGADGVTLRWSLTLPPRLDLPFVMSPYEPAPAIPEGDLRHANGLLRIASLEIESAQPLELAERLAAMLGGGTPRAADGVVMVEVAGFTYRIVAGREHRVASLRFNDGRTLEDVLAR
ncbi:MAG: VOC family protein [Chloroflexi bacterium]|nr:VOC family protein [Chloroflexota bacterium]